MIINIISKYEIVIQPCHCHDPRRYGSPFGCHEMDLTTKILLEKPKQLCFLRGNSDHKEGNFSRLSRKCHLGVRIFQLVPPPSGLLLRAMTISNDEKSRSIPTSHQLLLAVLQNVSSPKRQEDFKKKNMHILVFKCP